MRVANKVAERDGVDEIKTSKKFAKVMKRP
jgi:hypothetical protein